MYYKDLGFSSYDEYLQSQHWYLVNRAYDESTLPKYCYICDNPNYVLHHEGYDELGQELARGHLQHMVPLCQDCHEKVHFDEYGEKIPMKKEYLRERRMMLRRQYLLQTIRPTTILSTLYRLLYRLLW
jgi:hypothetical protein